LIPPVGPTQSVPKPPQGYRFGRTTAVPGAVAPQGACDPPPPQNETRLVPPPRCYSLLSSWSPWACRLTPVGNPWSSGPEADVGPRPGLFRQNVDREAMYPVASTRTFLRRPVAVKAVGRPLASAPTLDGPSAGRLIQSRSELTTIRVNARAGLSNLGTKDTPFVGAGLPPPTVANVGGSVPFRRPRGPLGFGRSGPGCSHRLRFHGACGSVVPHAVAGRRLALNA